MKVHWLNVARPTSDISASLHPSGDSELPCSSSNSTSRFTDNFSGATDDAAGNDPASQLSNFFEISILG